MDLTDADIRLAVDDRADPWALGNDVLYNLCRDHPLHTSNEAIIAKVWLIGRSYAAAVERRRPVGGNALANDPFYEERVVPAFKQPWIDDTIRQLGQYSSVDDGNLAEILAAHKRLTDLLHDLTRLNKRSFASKYLHFHLPSLFFIYDSRAATALKHIRPGRLPRVNTNRQFDPEYGRFASAALTLRDEIHTRFGQRLTPRQLDRLFLRKVR